MVVTSSVATLCTELRTSWWDNPMLAEGIVAEQQRWPLRSRVSVGDIRTSVE